MRLEITLVAGTSLSCTELSVPVELRIHWPPGAGVTGCSGDSLHRALELRWPGCDFSVAGQPLDSLQPGSAPLCNGAVVVAWPAGTAPGIAAVSEHRDTGAVALLAVCSGPAAGVVFALRRGSYSLGRGRCRLHLPDPALSRHHGTLVLGSKSIVLTATPGSSGFQLHRTTDGPTASAESVKGVISLVAGLRISCGNTQLELRLPGPAESGPPIKGLLTMTGTAPIAVPSPSGSGRGSVAMLITGLSPLLLGTALAVFTGSMMFLAFAAMGAVAVLLQLLGGRKRRRVFRDDVARAVLMDAERAARNFPDAATLVLAATEQVDTTAVMIAAADLALRLGLATRAGQIAPEPPDTSFTAPRLHCQPLTLPLGVEPIHVRGPVGPVLALLNYVLMQLDAAAVPVVLTGPAESIPWAARFLPSTQLATSRSDVLKAVAAAQRTHSNGLDAPLCVLLNVGDAAGAEIPLLNGLRVIHFELEARNSIPLPQLSEDRNTVRLRAHGPSIVGSLAGQDFVPDGVPPTVFAGYARRRACSSANQTDETGTSLSLNFAPFLGQRTPDSLSTAWAASAGGPLLPVPIGRSLAGTTFFSFSVDGPHLLVGGTTGSGKSEFLRALVGSLAAAHSPADLQFVFLDFKGGAGLGVLGKLPHTSSLVTDLGGHGMARTLASLRAELHRREAALSAVEAADGLSYRAGATDSGSGAQAMAHLVLVVDEFRVLVDQFPDAMTELMRIAAVGRSLGIHLVMATQRPQGAVNADIRANVTSSVSLRVQSRLDSIDIIGTPVAADISVDTPGRAYISRAGGPPEEFQSAVLGLPPSGAGLLPRVERLQDVFCGGGSPVRPLLADTAVLQAQDLDACGVEEVAEVMARAWAACRATDITLVAAPPVVAPELPAEVELGSNGGLALGKHAASVPDNGLPEAASCTGDMSPGVVELGVVDLPEQQCLKPLLWHPVHHSHLAFFGTGSETSQAVALVTDQLLAGNAHSAVDHSVTPRLYLLDADGSLEQYAASPWVGSYLTPDHLRTAARLVRRITETAKSSPHPLVLCISDWGRWTLTLRASPWHEAEDAIAELIRFGGKNFTVVVGGARELLTASLLAAIPNRMFLSNGSPAESTMLWPRLPLFAPLPGRAAIDGPINAAVAPAGAEHMHVAQLGRSSVGTFSTEMETAGDLQPVGPSIAAGVLQVRPLPQALSATEFACVTGLAMHASIGRGSRELVLGLGGDGCDLVHVRLEPGTVLAVVGGPQTGKSSFLQMLAKLNVAIKLDSLLPDSDATVSSAAFSAAARVILVDNPLSLTSGQLQTASAQLAAGAALVVALQYPGPALSRLPLEWGLRTLQQGVVMRPQRAMDAELFGIRLDTTGSEPPGRAILIDGARREWFQTPHQYVEHPEMHG